MLDGVTMVLKLGFILLFAGLVGILEVQAASVAIKNDMWNSLRQGGLRVRISFDVVVITLFHITRIRNVSLK